MFSEKFYSLIEISFIMGIVPDLTKLEHVGWADRVARRLSARERALIVEEDGKRKAIR
jgi:hypothetical protein